MTDWSTIPDGYFAVLDPTDPEVMTYWRRKGPNFQSWPAKAWYGPTVRRADLPGPGPEREAFVADWSARRRTYLGQIADAILADIPAAGRRFADFGIRCCQCGRALRDNTSKTYGIGPDCRADMDPVVLARYFTPQVGRAHAEALARPPA
jgi:hypothetical protein